MSDEIKKQKTELLPYSYPIRSSTTTVVFRIVLIQLLIGSLSLLATLPLVAFKEIINVYIPIIMLYAFFQLGFQMANMLLLVFTLLSWVNRVYIIRPKEVIEQKGIWHITENIYSLERVEEVTVDQSLWGRIFNYGTVQVYNPVLKEDLYLYNIPSPFMYAEVIKRGESKEIIRFLPRPIAESARQVLSHTVN